MPLSQQLLDALSEYETFISESLLNLNDSPIQYGQDYFGRILSHLAYIQQSKGITGGESISSNASTEATLLQVRDAIKAQTAIASTIWTDDSGAYYVRKDLVDEGTGQITVAFSLADGTPATPGAGLVPVADTNKDVFSEFYEAIASSTDYVIGDLLARVAIVSTSNTTPAGVFIWMNMSQGSILSTPPNPAHIHRANESIEINNFPSTQAVSLAILPAGTNFLGRVGQRHFKITGSIVRPANVDTYVNRDAITNSLSAPTPMSFDLAASGALPGDSFCIINAQIISNNAPANILVANVWIFNETFAATNDNSALVIPTTTAETGGTVIECLKTFVLGANSRCVSEPGLYTGKLNDSSTFVYFTVQAAAGYTPASGERFKILLEGYLP
jgi:hypothetical protein